MRNLQKLIVLSFFFGSSVMLAHGQIWNDFGKKLEKKIEKKASDRIEKKIDQTIDKGLDKAEESPKKINKTNSSSSQKPSTESPQNEVKPIPSSNTPSSNEEVTLKKYNKFSFIQGEKIIALDDFLQDAVGDLPASWVSTGTSEIVKFDHVDGHWVWFNKTKGNFVPEYLVDFPENFTLEFDLMVDFQFSQYSFKRLFAIIFSDISNPESKLDWDGDPGYFFLQKLSNNYTGIYFDANHSNGGPHITGRKAVAANKELNFTTNFQAKEFFNTNNILKPIHISISRTGRRMQVFANEEKVLDLTNAFEKNVKLTSARFHVINHTEADNYYISNIRYAVGQPDARNKLLDSGKFSTSAITFNSGSAVIKPESYAILKEIADALKSQSSRAVEIIGHTDSDGTDESNLLLSQKRADAVKTALQNEFGITNPISISGKGESTPIADNNSPAGKAQNRRVEFILK